MLAGGGTTGQVVLFWRTEGRYPPWSEELMDAGDALREYPRPFRALWLRCATDTLLLIERLAREH